MSKDFKVWGVRSDLIGDQIMALPILNWIENRIPHSYKFWSILRKCSQASPLYFNHPLIDKIVISDFNEGFGETDKFYSDQCNLKFNTRPQHLFEQDWHNYRDMYEETWVMAGLPLKEYHELSKEQQKPKLYKWFDVEKKPKTIAIHCFAGYGKDNHRSPSQEWWEKIIRLLWDNGYSVVRLGHPNEPHFFIDLDFRPKDIRNLSLIDQVKIALGCDLYIGTDSGFSLIMGAYNDIPQITLLTNWNAGHKCNFTCLSPNNDKNFSLFAVGNCGNISQEKVLETIKQII